MMMMMRYYQPHTHTRCDRRTASRVGKAESDLPPVGRLLALDGTHVAHHACALVRLESQPHHHHQLTANGPLLECVCVCGVCV
jgi:hypothetical protein